MRTRVGYAGGTTPSPTYYRMGNHTESFQIDFDPKGISYRELVRMFWSDYHPGGFSRQYMCFAFVANEEQRRIAMEEGPPKHQGAIVPLEAFFVAEDYHQKYYLRARADLMKLLAGYDDRMLRESTAAARLNAIAAGYGDVAAFQRELVLAQGRSS